MPNEIWWKLANFAVLAGGLGYLFRSTPVLPSGPDEEIQGHSGRGEGSR